MVTYGIAVPVEIQSLKLKAEDRQKPDRLYLTFGKNAILDLIKLILSEEDV